jgi:hypothetical protein
VYLGLIVLLVPVRRQGANSTRVRRLRELVGMSGLTVERWWRCEFVQTRFWRLARRQFAEPREELPGSLLERVRR